MNEPRPFEEILRELDRLTALLQQNVNDLHLVIKKEKESAGK